jgi:hypothetical protein
MAALPREVVVTAVALLQVTAVMAVVLLLQDLATAAPPLQAAVDTVALHLLVTAVLPQAVEVMVVHLLHRVMAALILRRVMVLHRLKDTEVQHLPSRRIITWHTVSVVAFSVLL